MKQFKLMLGDNMESLKKMPDNCIDSVVTDAPYGLSFMNKRWDYDVPSVELWKEVYRVLKPGGHLLSFGGTRTYHRMVVNIEDAGFEIRDQIQWLYGSGFPKSHNIGKAVDKLEGNEREEWLDEKKTQPNIRGNGDQLLISASGVEVKDREPIKHSKGNSPYEGWGTALKPANEPICVARKPLSEKSVAENVLKWGTGGINIEGCRVSFNGDKPKECELVDFRGDGSQMNLNASGKERKTIEDRNYIPSEEGRFPANIILECLCDEVIKGEKGEAKSNTREAGNSFNNYDDKKGKVITRIENYGDKGDIHTNPMCPCYLMDEQSGISKSNPRTTPLKGSENGVTEFGQGKNTNHTDSGGASRFFYVAKVSKSERNMGLDGFEEKESMKWNGSDGHKGVGDYYPDGSERPKTSYKNTHPTLKPVQLMSYLVRLVTPPNGIVLDPFMGSGSTGISACLEGFRFCGMEQEPEYFKIATARIENYEMYRKFLKENKKK